jgi:hypothetical protein
VMQHRPSIVHSTLQRLLASWLLGEMGSKP